LEDLTGQKGESARLEDLTGQKGESARLEDHKTGATS
jgi:hypothetical protein